VYPYANYVLDLRKVFELAEMKYMSTAEYFMMKALIIYAVQTLLSG
jgi:hypothetical protein